MKSLSINDIVNYLPGDQCARMEAARAYIEGARKIILSAQKYERRNVEMNNTELTNRLDDLAEAVEDMEEKLEEVAKMFEEYIVLDETCEDAVEANKLVKKCNDMFGLDQPFEGDEQ